jgi:hypothetical protein
MGGEGDAVPAPPISIMTPFTSTADGRPRGIEFRAALRKAPGSLIITQ